MSAIGWGLRLAPWIGAAVLAAAALAGAGVSWDPLGLERRRVQRLEAELVQAKAEIARLAADRDVQAQVLIEAARAADRGRAAERGLIVLETEARRADDAQEPVAIARLDRLSDHDRELCGLAPHLDGCAGRADPAGGGQAPMPAGDPAAGSDPGRS